MGGGGGGGGGGALTWDNRVARGGAGSGAHPLPDPLLV